MSARRNGPSRRVTAVVVDGLFFPQCRSLGIDQREASPAVLEKIVFAGTVGRSYGQASELLQKLAGLEVGEKQVERVTRAIGEERVAQRNVTAQIFQELPLTDKFALPAKVPAPDLAVVMVDGGRIQILDRLESAEAATPALEAAAAKDSEDWQEESRDAKGHWREDKVGLLMTMQSEASPNDPCPEIPESFIDTLRIPRLVRELKKNVKETEEAAGDSAEPAIVDQVLAEENKYEPPKVAERRVVASRCVWPSFAVLLAQAAWQWGFQGASRKAFVADGSQNNWTMHRRFFASFVAVLDFIHALSYVFAAAIAGRKFSEGWPIYRQWITWVWQGQAAQVIAALEERQTELGKPAQDEADTSPRKMVDKSLTYLRNHQGKMRYDEYRKAGMPITSSHMESMVKQINLRVKGTEKFWSEEGGEAILQLRADHLSDHHPLAEFWRRRQIDATGQRQHRRVG
jgi:hypothetical protein